LTSDTLPAIARFVYGLALWLCVVFPAGALHPAAAQSPYPDKPVRIINPFPAGSPVDYVGRLIANKLELAFGQPVVVESRSGAGGTVGANAVAKSAGDGCTLLVTSPSTLASAPA
jgi:tripartite-type tricarboxylate transporter receptor subunit TctC